MKLKTSICRLIAATATAWAVILGGHPASAVEFRVGYMPYVLFASSLVAKQNGWVEEQLRKAGLNDVSVKWVQFLDGPTTNEAFASGRIDAAVLGDTPALIAKAVGQDTIAVGLSSCGPKTMALLARTDAAIQRIADLKGRKIGTLKGSSGHELLFLLLEGAKLKPADIEFVNMGLADMSTALQTRSVDAVVGWEPLITRLTSDGVGRVVRDATGLKRNCYPVIAEQQFAKANPAVIRAYLQALQRADVELATRPAQTASLISGIVGLKPDLAEKSIRTFEWDVHVTPVDRRDFEHSMRFLLENGLIKRSFDVGGFVDTSFAP